MRTTTLMQNYKRRLADSPLYLPRTLLYILEGGKQAVKATTDLPRSLHCVLCYRVALGGVGTMSVTTVSALQTLTISIVCYSLVLVLIHHVPHKYLPTAYSESSKSGVKPLPVWPEDFSHDIIPVACHSHNEFW